MEKRGLDELRGGEKGKEGWGGELGAFASPAGKRGSCGMREVEWWRGEGGWSVGSIRGSPAAPGSFLGSLKGPSEEGMLGMKPGNRASRGAPSRVGSTGRKLVGCVEIREGGKGQEGREWAGGKREQLCFDWKRCLKAAEPGDQSCPCSGECLGPAPPLPHRETPKPFPLQRSE